MPKLPANPTPELVAASEKISRSAAEYRQALIAYKSSLVKVRRAQVAVKKAPDSFQGKQAFSEAQQASQRARALLFEIRDGRSEEIADLEKARLGAKKAPPAPATSGEEVLPKTAQVQLDAAVARFRRNWLKNRDEKLRKNMRKRARLTTVASLNKKIADARARDSQRFQRDIHKVEVNADAKLRKALSREGTGGKSDFRQRKLVELRRNLRKAQTQQRKLQERITALAPKS